MAVQVTRTASMSLAGKTFPSNKNGISADAATVNEETLPVAQGGSLTTRTDNTDGEITADASGHGIQTGDRVDLYWTEAGVDGSRRGVDVGTVAGAAIPISGGLGDNLPSQDNDITVAPAIPFDMVFEGDDLVSLAAYIGSAARGQFVLEDAGGEELFEKIGPNQSYHYYEGQGPDNPVAGDSIITGYLSHADESATATGRIGAHFDN